MHVISPKTAFLDIYQGEKSGHNIVCIVKSGTLRMARNRLSRWAYPIISAFGDQLEVD